MRSPPAAFVWHEGEKIAAYLGQQADGRKEAERMKRIRGVWYYNGNAYTTLTAALVAAWLR